MTHGQTKVSVKCVWTGLPKSVSLKLGTDFLITNNKQLKLNDIVNNDTGRLPITLFM